MIDEMDARKRVIRHYDALENLKEQQPCKLTGIDINKGHVETLNRFNVLDEVDKDGHGQKVWMLTQTAERLMKSYDGGGLLPCTCSRDAFVTVEAGETVRCKSCGEEFSTDVVG